MPIRSFRQVLSAAVALVVLAACAHDADTYEAGPARAGRRVLVAGAQSEFKRKVMDRVVQKLGVQEYYFRVTGLDGLAAADLSEYGAVLVLYSLPGGRMDERVARFIGRNKGNPKIIVFYTRGLDARTEEELEAAADQLRRSNQYADQLAELIARRFRERVIE
jgi:hypothetical protein